MTYILAIDTGSQSVRALLIDLKGNIVSKARVELDMYFSTRPGWAEQHAGYFWESLCRACQKLWTQPETPPDVKAAIEGVALTTQRGTLVNVDRDGKPLRPAISWMDMRRTEGLKPVGGLWGAIFRLVNMSETVAYLQAEAESNWIRTHEPEIWSKTYKFLLLSGYLTFRLTGQFVDSVGCQVGYLPFDYKKLTWAANNDWKWEAIPMPREILPDLIPPTETLGQITPEAATATGIPAGLPLIAAGADKACEVIGSGCLEPHIGCLSFGTNATINITSRKYVEPIPLIPPYPAAVPNAYSLEISIYRGFWMISWFKKEFGHHEMQLAEQRGIEPEMLFDEMVNAVPPGSEGLILQPYWSPGIKIPGPEARGAIIGFNDMHTRAHLYRSIVEGLIYALRENKERAEKRTKIPVTELRVSGGGSQSDAALQITADIFGLPATRLHTYETSGLGAAIDAAVGLKFHPNFETAIKEMVRTGKRFEPNKTNHQIYEELFQNVYRHLYSRVRPLYHEIRRIIMK